MTWFLSWWWTRKLIVSLYFHIRWRLCAGSRPVILNNPGQSWRSRRDTQKLISCCLYLSWPILHSDVSMYLCRYIPAQSPQHQCSCCSGLCSLWPCYGTCCRSHCRQRIGWALVPLFPGSASCAVSRLIPWNPDPHSSLTWIPEDEDPPLVYQAIELLHW